MSRWRWARRWALFAVLTVSPGCASAVTLPGHSHAGVTVHLNCVGCKAAVRGAALELLREVAQNNQQARPAKPAATEATK